MKKLLLLVLPTIMLGSALIAQERASRDLLKERSFPEGMEGPAIDKYGNLYAVSYLRRGTIAIVDPVNQKVSLYLTLPEGSTGNGIRFSKDGIMYIADYTGHKVLFMKPGSTMLETYSYNPAMNQPNDLTICNKTGVIYLSDPNWTQNNGNLWMVLPGGKVILVESEMGTTNGVEITRDGTKLYVNESNQRNIWVYKIDREGRPYDKRLFIKFSDFGMDGMRCDSKGNLYVSRYGAGMIVKISPNGKVLKEYRLKGKNCTNITLSLDEKTAYVTMQDRGCFEVIDL